MCHGFGSGADIGILASSTYRYPDRKHHLFKASMMQEPVAFSRSRGSKSPVMDDSFLSRRNLEMRMGSSYYFTSGPVRQEIPFDLTFQEETRDNAFSSVNTEDPAETRMLLSGP